MDLGPGGWAIFHSPIENLMFLIHKSIFVYGVWSFIWLLKRQEGTLSQMPQHFLVHNILGKSNNRKPAEMVYMKEKKFTRTNADPQSINSKRKTASPSTQGEYLEHEETKKKEVKEGGADMEWRNSESNGRRMGTAGPAGCSRSSGSHSSYVNSQLPTAEVGVFVSSHIRSTTLLMNPPQDCGGDPLIVSWWRWKRLRQKQEGDERESKQTPLHSHTFLLCVVWFSFSAEKKDRRAGPFIDKTRGNVMGLVAESLSDSIHGIEQAWLSWPISSDSTSRTYQYSSATVGLAGSLYFMVNPLISCTPLSWLDYTTLCTSLTWSARADLQAPSYSWRDIF